MECNDAKIISNENIAPDIYQMKLHTSISSCVKPGQFVQVQVPGYYLRRPISVCEVNGSEMTLIYKVVGKGTDVMHAMKAGQNINLFGPLGNGFPIEEKDVVLIGGGVGIPPLVETAKQYRRLNRKVTAVLGFNTKEQIFLDKRFEELGCDVIIATMDGSFGEKGTVIDAMQAKGIRTEFVEACGPMPMLKAVNASCHGYISLESRMACGIGACMGCVVKDIHDESMRVCKDGPVFETGKVVL
jgi:dihydroorotate dehydrogenase electron transfer subunit